MSNPLVSIVCITYNHEPYLRQALDGFLMQKTSFAYEIVLAEDCSTDNTRKICEEYAAKYPGIIHYIWSDNNVGAVENEARALRVARGEYIALCEGDDYWTDSMKLQKQVAFMESHPKYSVTFHRYKIHYQGTDTWQEDNAGNLFKENNSEGTDITVEQSFDTWITQYLTAVFRRECYDFKWADKYQWYRDSHMSYHLMTRGKAYLFAFEGGVYRKTGSGIYTNLDRYHMQLRTIDVCREMWEKNADERLRNPYIKAMQYFVDSFCDNQEYKKDALRMAWKIFGVGHNLKALLKNSWKIIR